MDPRKNTVYVQSVWSIKQIIVIYNYENAWNILPYLNQYDQS